MSSTAYFIQFPHPGQEQAPRDMPWNTQTHRRKFLIGSGRYLEDGDAVADADQVFWGEWEPPSRVIATWPPSGRMPRAIHRPHWIRPARNTARQNTDPWVWGERMLYSNCRQTSGSPIRTPNSMQRLTRGSVICFGSTLDGVFCLDTVFVVGSAEPWDPAHGVAADIDEAFRICTSDPLIARDDGSGVALSCATGAPLTLYRGATVDDPVEGMFSFVPARRADARDRRFARPAVRLSIEQPRQHPEHAGFEKCTPPRRGARSMGPGPTPGGSRGPRARRARPDPAVRGQRGRAGRRPTALLTRATTG